MSINVEFQNKVCSDLQSFIHRYAAIGGSQMSDKHVTGQLQRIHDSLIMSQNLTVECLDEAIETVGCNLLPLMIHGCGSSILEENVSAFFREFEDFTMDVTKHIWRMQEIQYDDVEEFTHQVDFFIRDLQ